MHKFWYLCVCFAVLSSTAHDPRFPCSRQESADREVTLELQCKELLRHHLRALDGLGNLIGSQNISSTAHDPRFPCSGQEPTKCGMTLELRWKELLRDQLCALDGFENSIGRENISSTAHDLHFPRLRKEWFQFARTYDVGTFLRYRCFGQGTMRVECPTSSNFDIRG